MQGIGALGGRVQCNIYGEQINLMFKKGRTDGKVRNTMLYSKLIPPWLRPFFHFVHESNSNRAIPCNYRVLSRQDVPLQAGRKPLLIAIIAPC